MAIKYNIPNKNSIHISFEKEEASLLIDILSELIKNNAVHIEFVDVKKYRGKQLRGLTFLLVKKGEFVSFQEGRLFFEIEKAMVGEFIFFIENAIKDDGFRTPEIISFSPKFKKEEEVTIYGFLVEKPC